MSFEKLFASLNDLPVATIAADATQSVASGIVTTLSSATGSGKTLFQTAHLADTLPEQVVVLVPRRFLAVNAAETISKLSGCTIGDEVGYAIGSQTGDRSRYKETTKLLFATNGFALASNLIQTATTIVLDEVHEKSMDLSIIRAILHYRIQRGAHIKLLEMSATIDATRQASYWNKVSKTKIYTIDGKTHDCEFRHRPARTPADEVMNLIAERKRGILVFRPGVGEVNETANEIRKQASLASIEVEVATIYGDMDYAQRDAATRPSKVGAIKVLIGTNVVESGANITWLDAGVTCGTSKESSERAETGATYLELIDLPQWRIQQQMGRVNRFRTGVFVLCARKSLSERILTTKPEIERLALTALVMHCANFGLRTHELTFDHAPNPTKIVEAEQKLQRLGILDSNCSLTDAGTYIAKLPIGPETGAMLWHTKQIGCIKAALPLAAVVEVGNLRKNHKEGHGCDNTSDFIDSLNAFSAVFLSRGKNRKYTMDTYNVSYKKFEAACELLSDLEKRLGVTAIFENEDRQLALRQAILAGSVDKLFVGVGYRGDFASLKNRNTTYRLGEGSVVYNCTEQSLVAGDLRVITPRDPLKSPFTILEKVSVFAFEDLQSIAQVRPEILITEKQATIEYKGKTSFHVIYNLFGKYFIKTATLTQNPNTPAKRTSETAAFGNL